MKELKRYLGYMGKYSTQYWIIFLITIITSILLNQLFPYMNKLMFNSIEYGDKDMFYRAVVFCVILLIINCGFPYLRYFQMRVVRKIVFDIKIRLFDKLLNMDMKFYESNHSGEVLKTLNWDANSLKDSYFSHIFWVVSRVINGVVTIVAMILYNHILGSIALGFCVVTVALSWIVNKKIKESDVKINSAVAGITTRIIDILDGFFILKMYPGVALVEDDYYNRVNQVYQSERSRAIKVSSFSMVTFLLSILSNFGTIIVGAYMVAKGMMDYGTIMAIVALGEGASYFLRTLAKTTTIMSSSLAKAGRVFDFLELKGEEAYTGEECIIKENSPAIDMKKISFSYGEKNVINNYSLSLNEKESVMIMGESGCGKSTLIKLIMGFYKCEGEVSIFGNNINEVSLKSLRNLITYIPQESYLFEGSIRDNIAYGTAKEVSEEDIVKAAKFAYADEFINELPNGYDTRIDAGGHNLSGGQRQRIAIARAFLKNSPIILMDEPSSALDSQSEAMVNMAIKELTKDKAVIMISHITNAANDFERIVVME